MRKKYDTEISVRPHEVDINGHVHQSVYFDYVLYARWDQMHRCYKMPMEEFFKRGLSWTTKSASIEFHKPLFLGEKIIVRTWIEETGQKSVKVRFQILKKETENLATEGEFVYVLINARTGRPELIPEDIAKKYSA
ncbi:MAG: acyl-CoA thioesterase [Candidatus Aminicenantes bacterium]|nr:MAG: acyl-CoA thioesterase [Candidatus Aminicenantes bacterium]